MVEFSDDDEEGNHDCIHGGEPLLVLCKIYKAHSSSRSSAARKRKPTDELLNQVSISREGKAPAFRLYCINFFGGRVTGTGQLQSVV
jgi:hypothetical protein